MHEEGAEGASTELVVGAVYMFRCDVCGLERNLDKDLPEEILGTAIAPSDLRLQ